MEVGIFGIKGSGKTTIAIMWARRLRDYALKYFGHDIPIFTNAAARGDGIVIIQDLGDIPFDRSPKILILDEAMFSVDSRQSSSKTNQLWSQAIAFFRKVNLTVFFVTHDYGLIDVRIRNHLAYITMCRKAKDRFEYLIVDPTTYQKRSMYLPRHKSVFDYCDFDTNDFPFPIRVDELVKKVPQISLYK